MDSGINVSVLWSCLHWQLASYRISPSVVVIIITTIIIITTTIAIIVI